MLKSAEGIYRDGKIELTELPSDVRAETRVIVTFLESRSVDLASRGLDETQSADLHARLATFASDWESPGMSAYDNYDGTDVKL